MKKIITFRDDYAFMTGEKYNKDDVMNLLIYNRNLSTTKKVKKEEDKSGTIIYHVVTDNEQEKINYQIRFPKRNQEDNFYLIEEFDNWVSNYKKCNLQRLKLVAILCAVSIAGTAKLYEPVKEGAGTFGEFMEDLLTDEVAELDWEILVHYGHGYIDGEKVNPHYGSCSLGDDKSISVPDRISLYCEEYGLEYLEEAALQRYDYLLHDKMEEGNSIDLKALEKAEKQRIKTLQQQ